MAKVQRVSWPICLFKGIRYACNLRGQIFRQTIRGKWIKVRRPPAEVVTVLVLSSTWSAP